MIELRVHLPLWAGLSVDADLGLQPRGLVLLD